MPETYTIQVGDSILNVAEEHGLFPDTIWNDPANADLRRERKDPDVLAPGDVLTIPDKRPGEVTKPTGEQHRFRRKGVPVRLRIRLMRDGKPRANLDYTLEIDHEPLDGQTDADGWLAHWISPSAREARLRIGEQETYKIKLGHLQPSTEDAGIRQRLANLGFLDDADTRDTKAVRAALMRFQERENLTATGEADEATRARLVEVHAR